MSERILKALLRALPIAIIIALVAVGAAFGQDGVSNDELAYALDNIVLFIAAVLVFFMQAGFAMLEAGLNESKNTINILMKNFLDLSLGVLLYFVIGYGIMYPGEFNGYIGFAGVGIGGAGVEALPGALNLQVDWLFQVAFAATAATIVSGAVAGRMKFGAYLIYTIFLTGLIYPISGSWKWGGGWLDAMGFYDFAGSIVVHAVGGFAGLAGAVVLGPRIGRFNEDGSANELPASNMGIAMLGVLILWIGWYGFNPGSQLAFAGAANTDATMLIAANTTLAAALGTIAAMLGSWAIEGKPKLGYSINGALAGLVGITANCDGVTNSEAIIIGAIAGILVIAGMKMLEAAKIDDPVGAWPVHGLCGVWGGVATGIFAGPAAYGAGVAGIGVQILASVVIPVWAFVTMFILFSILKAAGYLRVSEAEEMAGLDGTEHGEAAYAVPVPAAGD